MVVTACRLGWSGQQAQQGGWAAASGAWKGPGGAPRCFHIPRTRHPSHPPQAGPGRIYLSICLFHTPRSLLTHGLLTPCLLPNHRWLDFGAQLRQMKTNIGASAYPVSAYMRCRNRLMKSLVQRMMQVCLIL